MRFSYTALVLATVAIGKAVAGPYHKHQHSHFHAKKGAEE